VLAAFESPYTVPDRLKTHLQQNPYTNSRMIFKVRLPPHSGKAQSL
jgi:hypothetical protein